MQPTKLTLFEVFERQRRYVVPLYQRPYVWTLEKQWEPLWEDVTAKATEVLERRRRMSPHFLGAVVLSRRRDVFGKEVDTSDVIDGQQRLTTIQVLLAAFRDQLPSASEALRRDINHLLENTCSMEYAFERFKVWPTNADQEVYEFVMTAGSRGAIDARFPPREGRKRLQQPRLVEAYSFFYDSVGAFLRGDDGAPAAGSASPDGRAEALFEALRRNLQLVVIELEEDDDPQVIFETLNARGEPLLPSDLVRNFVFLRAARQGADPNTLYTSWWREYDEAPAEDTNEPNRFWKREEKRGRLKRSRLDLFLHDYLQLRLEREVRIDHLYREFRDWWNVGGDRPVESELKQLQAYSTFYAKLLVPDQKTRLGVFAHRLQCLDTTTVNPLLLYLFVEAAGKLQPAELPGILTDLESYLVRRLVCGLTTKNYNRFFTSLLKKLRGAAVDAPVNREFLGRLLVEETGDSVRWPDDKEFERAWLQQPAYLRMVAPRIEMILSAIDLQLQTSKQEQLHIADDLTIEHVLPQHWQEHWPAPPSPAQPVAPGNESPEDRRERLLHSFGNLTLLTQPLNSSVSNGPFDDKRKEIAKQSRLRLNAYFQEVMSWNEEEILRRGSALFEIARVIWPYPGRRT